jgi:hypothetical protein
MTDKDDSAKKTAKGKGTIITLSMSPEDAERLKQAFAEGRLKELGITEIEFPPEEPEPGKKQWRQDERRKRRKTKGDDTPPLP